MDVVALSPGWLDQRRVRCRGKAVSPDPPDDCGGMLSRLQIIIRRYRNISLIQEKNIVARYHPLMVNNRVPIVSGSHHLPFPDHAKRGQTDKQTKVFGGKHANPRDRLFWPTWSPLLAECMDSKRSSEFFLNLGLLSKREKVS